MDLLKQRNWFDSPQFEEEFHCNEPMGSFCTPEGTVFRLWAPTAQSVTLHFYAEGNGGDPWGSVSLRKEGKGLWIFETERNLDGVYYEYEVTVDNVSRLTADPYARACGVPILSAGRRIRLRLQRRRASFMSFMSRIFPGIPPVALRWKIGVAIRPSAVPELHCIMTGFIPQGWTISNVLA